MTSRTLIKTAAAAATLAMIMATTGCVATGDYGDGVHTHVYRGDGIHSHVGHRGRDDSPHAHVTSSYRDGVHSQVTR